MKRFVLIRHAKSSWKDPDLRDFERPLNKRGFRDAPFMGRLLAAKKGSPDLILSSTALRAMTTARYFADAAGIPAEQIRQEEAIYEAMPGDVIRILQGLPESVGHVWVFGHNPTFTSLANLFEGEFLSNLPTCGIAEITADIADWRDLAPGRGKRSALFYPKQYFD